MKVNEFESCGAGCGIYLIRNLINNRVYIGQTTRKFKVRWQEYVAITKNLDAKKNITAIILAMRKYGIENFDFSILEICKKESLDEREQFWIKTFNADSHNNYNQTAGGQNAALKSSKPLWFSELVNELKNTTVSFTFLADKYNISDSLVCDINYGRRYYDSNIIYPIRPIISGLKMQIIDAIKNSKLTFEEIAVKYNCSLSTIKRINAGTGKYKIIGQIYPLRPLKKLDFDKIIELLSTTDLSFEDIAKLTNATSSSIYKINQGIRNFKENLSYPIRK